MNQASVVASGLSKGSVAIRHVFTYRHAGGSRRGAHLIGASNRPAQAVAGDLGRRQEQSASLSGALGDQRGSETWGKS